jgi:hypothetical protein
MEGLRELLNEMRASVKSGHHRQVLARMDDEISFGECNPITRAIFNFMLGRSPAEHRAEAKRLRKSGHLGSEELAEFHELFAEMLD